MHQSAGSYSDLRRMLQAALALSVLTSPQAAFAAVQDLPETMGVRTVAGTNGLAASWINPATLTTDGAAEVALLGNGRGAWGGGFGAGGFGLSLRQRQGMTRSDEAGIHTLLPLTSGLNAGATWRLGRRNGVAGQDFDLGLLWRPSASWSLGYAHRGLAGSLGGPSTEQLGVAWRPWDERLTVNLDHAWAGGSVEQGRTSTGVQWSMVPGLDVFLQAGRDLALVAEFVDELRIGLSLGHGRHRLATVLDGDAALDTTVAAGWRFTDRPAPSAVWPDKVVLSARLGGDLQQSAGLVGLIQALPPRPATAPVLEALERNGQDSEVHGLYLRIDPLDLSLGELQELRDGLARFKAREKKLYVHVSGGGLPELYLASVADQVYLAPGAQLDVSGFADELLMYGDLLKQVGVHADFVATGPYKSAVEPYLRNSLSDGAREQLVSLLRDRSDQIVSGLASARNLPAERLRAMMDQGLLRADQPGGLADGTGHPDEVEARLCKEAGVTEPESLLERVPADNPWVRPRIAVITLQGTMAQGGSGSDLLMGQVLGAADAVSVLDQARKEDAIAGVILRLESPGGDADAAEEIRRAVERLASTKPVVASIGPVAASGGYWVACGAPYIFAEPGSITGSIGVFAGKFSFGGLMGRFGVSADGAQEGRLAAAGTSARPFSPDERRLLEDSVRHTYRRFLDLVAQARKKDFADVEKLASGRVYTGRQALEAGLVDAMGGLDEARTWLAGKTGVRPEEAVILYGKGQGKLDAVADALSGRQAATRGIANLVRWTSRRTWALDARFQERLAP